MFLVSNTNVSANAVLQRIIKFIIKKQFYLSLIFTKPILDISDIIINGKKLTNIPEVYR